MTTLSVEARPVRQEADEGLVASVRAGDDRAFELLYQRYQARIGAYVLGMVRDRGRAEDITQDVFISALRRMRATDQPLAFKPWIYEIAKNACIDAFRRGKRGEEVSFDAWDGWAVADQRRMVSDGAATDDAVDAKQRLADLRGAFGGLSETHHDILVLREFEGLSYETIGERLGLSQAAVESTLFRARRKLGEEYEELTSGARCQQVRRIIATAGARAPGLRDERRMARHISHCQPCRRYAVLAGVEVAARDPRPAAVRIAALLPLPAFLKRRWSIGQPEVFGVHAASPQLAQWSASMAQTIDPSVAGWGKAVATAATVAIAGISAGAATHSPIRFGSSVSPGAIVKRLGMGGGDDGTPAPPPTVTPRVATTSPSHGGSTGIVYDSGIVPNADSSRSADDDPPLHATTHGLTGLGTTGHATPQSTASAPVAPKSDAPSPSAPAAAPAGASTNTGRSDTTSTPPTTGLTTTPSSASPPSQAPSQGGTPASSSPVPNLSGAQQRRPLNASGNLPSVASSPPAAVGAVPQMSGGVGSDLKDLIASGPASAPRETTTGDAPAPG